MVGSGALYWALKPRDAVLSDVNAELINFYGVLQRRPKELCAALRGLKASRRRYYTLRGAKPTGELPRAVRFAYLNRLAWNGLYRVNQNGDFNVPIGDRSPARLWKMSELRAASTLLQGTRLRAADFGHILRHASKGDFVYLDPPYPRGTDETLGFNRYSSGRFELNDHRRLAKWVGKLTERDVRVMLTISGLSRIVALYPSGLHRHYVRSKALISCNGSGRRSVREVILTNYRSQGR
jgi:DNA adenine methylase